MDIGHRVGGVRLTSVMLLTLVAACTTHQPPPPSEAEARAFLDEIVEAAVSRDFEALCALGGGSCESFLADPGGRDVPSDRPTVVGIRFVHPRANGPRPRTGGYVLELCGRDLDGDPFYSEMLVFRDVAGELRAIEPLYWMGITIADDDSVGRDPNSAGVARCADSTIQARQSAGEGGSGAPGGIRTPDLLIRSQLL
jgi:hypothetical protein